MKQKPTSLYSSVGRAWWSIQNFIRVSHLTPEMIT